MKTVGFLVSDKPFETRRCLLPCDIKRDILNPEMLFFEKGFGKVLGLSDEAFTSLGCHVADRNDIYSCDVLCDPKFGDSKELGEIHDKVLFGWFHAVRNKPICDLLLKNRNTAYAWEDMFYGPKNHVFWENNFIAGEASLLHAFASFGTIHFCNAAVLGDGNTSKGAQKILSSMNIPFRIFHRKDELDFKNSFGQFDLIVNAVLWDIERTDHLVNRSDLARMPKGSLIIDISCDESGAIETSHSTEIDQPIYFVDGVGHYAVDHTPTILFRDSSLSISKALAPFVNEFIADKRGPILEAAKIVSNGVIIDPKISLFRSSHHQR